MPHEPEHEEESMPSAAALQFIKGSVSSPNGREKSRTKKVHAADSIAPKKADRPARISGSPGEQKRRVKRSVREVVDSQPGHYVLLSTKIRTDLKRRLAELRHQRMMASSRVCTLKQFIELAVEKWLISEQAVGVDRPIQGEPREVRRHVPRQPFNNQIRVDLKRKLLEASHRRRMSGDPSHTIVAIVEEAIVAWLEACQAKGFSGSGKSETP